jgi:hypothetical protein
MVVTLINTPQDRRLYQQEYAIQCLTDTICEMMEETGMDRETLAAAMGLTVWWLSRFLDGRGTMDIRRAADAATAMGYTLTFGFKRGLVDEAEAGRPSDESLSRMSPKARATFEHIRNLRKGHAIIEFDVEKALRELRDNE